jgi:uncharacterized RDD family membrane protein YckC
MPSGPRPARLGDRLIAVLLDTICLAALLLVGAAAIWWNRLLLHPVFVGIAGGLGIIFVYYWVLEGAFGATLGKAIIGVRVESVDGGPSGFGSSATRNALRLVEGLPLYIPGFFVAVFSKSHRRLGDYIANTVVLEQPVRTGWRVAIVILWLAIIAGSVWGAMRLRPEWLEILPPLARLA